MTPALRFYTASVDFDRRLRLEFHGTRITSDAGLLAYRELDGALGLTDLAGAALSECRRGWNTRHLLTGLFRQSVFGRLAGYEDVNDAERLAHDPAMRAVVDRTGLDRQAASTSQMGRFETGWLTIKANLAALADLSGAWIDRVHARRPQTTIVLDMDSAADWRDVLEPVVARYRSGMKRRYFRGDAAYANPGIYEFLEAEGYKYTVRLPANAVLQDRIGWLLKRPVGRPPRDVRRYYASFSYQAASWNKARRVVAKVEWRPGELYPRVGFIVTNISRPPERVTLFYNQRGAAEQHIKEGKNAIVWTRLSCRRFAANAVRLQLHALAYNLANFLRTLTLPNEVSHWSMTTLRDRLVKIGAKVVRHGRSITFQMAEVMVSHDLFQQILDAIAALRPSPLPRC
ncbi:MAG: IS1380 family transposase [Phenylobacterium sp.]|uniref:IS1380 family transposase n=1 Tax=Phenylobacterium sp. TaxID=1871053 RepID=UPI003BB668EA